MKKADKKLSKLFMIIPPLLGAEIRDNKLIFPNPPKGGIFHCPVIVMG